MQGLRLFYEKLLKFTTVTVLEKIFAKFYLADDVITESTYIIETVLINIEIIVPCGYLPFPNIFFNITYLHIFLLQL